MDVGYCFSSKLGEFILAREKSGWVITFNAVEIGREYASAEQAVSALKTRREFGKSLSELISNADAPAMLVGWQRLMKRGPQVNGLMGDDPSSIRKPRGPVRPRSAK